MKAIAAKLPKLSKNYEIIIKNLYGIILKLSIVKFIIAFGPDRNGKLINIYKNDFHIMANNDRLSLYSILSKIKSQKKKK